MQSAAKIAPCAVAWNGSAGAFRKGETSNFWSVHFKGVWLAVIRYS